MEKVYKTWGYEHWFVNNDKYCGKLLFVNKNMWSSKGAYHYHKLKTETFFVIDGTLRLDYIDLDGTFKMIILYKYDSFHVPAKMKHRFTAISDGCTFIEASTTHRDDDSYREKWDGEEWISV
jgi:mannose-6-phosphate isomerase-like protein (cupin superfamily)